MTNDLTNTLEWRTFRAVAMWAREGYPPDKPVDGFRQVLACAASAEGFVLDPVCVRLALMWLNPVKEHLYFLHGMSEEDALDRVSILERAELRRFNQVYYAAELYSRGGPYNQMAYRYFFHVFWRRGLELVSELHDAAKAGYVFGTATGVEEAPYLPARARQLVSSGMETAID